MSVEEFLRLHRDEAVRLAIALTGRREVGEDVAHDVLMRVSDRLGSLDNPGGYLRRSLVNACRSWHRSAMRESSRLQRDVDASPRTVDLTADTGEALAALAVLTYRQRTAIVLRYWGQWDDAEIAVALRCRQPTVRTLIHRGLQQLREELGS